MATLLGWIEELAEGQPVLGVVIGAPGWGDPTEPIPKYMNPRNKLLTWEEAKPYLTYEFYAGYGSPQCNGIYAWTKDWVIAISQYDGATAPFRIPRNPQDCEPEMPGGG